MIPQIGFITGASRGIGAAVAEELASQGFHLAINARNSEPLEELAQHLEQRYSIRCIPIAGNAGEEGFAEQAFARIKRELGALTVLVNNAGMSQIGLFTEMRPEQWQEILQTNLTAAIYCSQEGAREMLHEKRGRIINISSVWGQVGASCEVAYSATKGAINAFTKALAKELAPSGIQVNAIACGVIDTTMNQCFTQEERQQLCQEIPTGRFGTTQEVAQLVSMLIQAPEYLTGEIITLDGGWI